MKDPVRLLDGDATDVERALLRAGATEEPPPEGALRLATALGLSTALLHASKAAASASTPPAAAAAAAPLVAPVALKWLALAMGGVTIAATVLVMRGGDARPTERDAGAAERAPSAPAPAVPAAPGKPHAPQNTAADEAAAVDPTPPEEALPRRRLEAGRVRSKSIAREIEQLDTARDRLQRGQARAALAVLDDYRREHAQGVLGQEAELLRIEALSRAGEGAAARRLAERFLRDNPQSPHEDRIRALVGDADSR
jgi:hypothetical protein